MIGPLLMVIAYRPPPSTMKYVIAVAAVVVAVGGALVFRSK